MDSEALWIWNKDLQDLGSIYKVPGSSVLVSMSSRCGIHLPPGFQAEHAGQVRQLWALLGGGSPGQDHSVPNAKGTQTVPCGVLAWDADTDLWNVTVWYFLLLRAASHRPQALFQERIRWMNNAEAHFFQMNNKIVHTQASEPSSKW